MAEEKEKGKMEENKEVTPEQKTEPTETTQETQPAGEALSSDVRNMGMLCHLLAIFPGIFGLIGPLIIWLTKKESNPFIDQNGKAVINFLISMIIYYMVCIFTFIFMWLLPVLILIQLVFVVIGAMKASEGKVYRYPIAIRFLK